jgi:hypothetical protein
MSLSEILKRHGYVAPFAAVPTQPGTVNDARGRAIPFLIVPGVLGADDRRAFSEQVAALLNDEAATGERRAA